MIFSSNLTWTTKCFAPFNGQRSVFSNDIAHGKVLYLTGRTEIDRINVLGGIVAKIRNTAAEEGEVQRNSSAREMKRTKYA